MKEMYYILGLAGWIWLAIVLPLGVGAWVARRRRDAPRATGEVPPPTDGRDTATPPPTDRT